MKMSNNFLLPCLVIAFFCINLMCTDVQKKPIDVAQQQVNLMIKAVQSKLKPREIDGRYAPYKVQEIVEKFADQAMSFDQIVSALTYADSIAIEYLVNAYAALLVQKDKERVKKIVSENVSNDIPLHLHIYLKKHVALQNAGRKKEYSIADALEQKSDLIYTCGTDTQTFVTIFGQDRQAGDMKISSLYGLEKINPEADSLELIEMPFMLNAAQDPDFPNKPFESFKKLTSLTLNTDIVSKVTPSFLAGLKLEYLQIGKSVSEFDPELFKGLSTLEWLDLSGNTRLFFTKEKKDTFFKNVSVCLSGLEQLSLSGCGLCSLETGYFDNFVNLKFLNLSCCSLSDLPNNIFERLVNLETLNLQENHINTVRSDMFKGLSNLKELDLGRCQVRTILKNAFRGLDSLEVLDMYTNGITDLKEECFAGLHNLKKLILANNYLGGIKKLSSNLFSKLSKLEELKLYRCGIHQIEADAFSGLNNLRVLDLSSNDLATEQASLFKRLSKLEKINLSYNSFSKEQQGLIKKTFSEYGLVTVLV